MTYRQRYIILSFLLLFLQPGNIWGQIHPLPPLQPEQEACKALTLCGGYFYTPYSYSGYGAYVEAIQGGVLTGGGAHSENNSVWFRVDVVTAGTIVFKITPNNAANDYDFTVWDGTVANCGYLQSYTYQRLRTNGNVPDGTDGAIGLNYTSTLTRTEPGTIGSAFLQYIDAPAGHYYYILVDNYTGSADGFSIDFAGSTAGFKSTGPPAYNAILSDCYTEKGMTIHLDKPVACGSIAPDGSDFELLKAGTATITGARGINCNIGTGYTRDIFIAFSTTLPPNNYTLNAKRGTDGNALLGLCGDEQLPGDHIDFFYWEPIKMNAGRDTATCRGNTLSLQAQVTGGYNNKIRWEPAAYLNNAVAVNPVAALLRDTFFVLTVSDAFSYCVFKDTVQVKVLQGFDLLNNDTAICKGGSVNLEATGDSRYQYVWTPGTYLAGTAPLSRTATPEKEITYTLRASYPGCADTLQSVKIDVEPVPQVSIDNDAVFCDGDTLYMNATVFPADYNAYRYSWTPAAVFNDSVLAHPLFNAATDANISLTVTTAHGCTGKADKKINVYRRPKAEAGPDVITAAGKPLTLQGSTDDPLAAIRWTPALYLSSDRILTPVVTPLASQRYYLMVTGAGNCSAYDSVLVKTYNEINVPNVFSPNGDGIHDKWTVDYLKDYPLATIDVFDRWGQLVYHTDASHANGWDGMLNGKPLPAGAYYYIIQPRANGYGKITGAVTLIR
jgi:gliding motility-associated-like protein